MAKNRTTYTDASVDDYLAERGNAGQQSDCRYLIDLMKKITGEPARMWGPSIVGFGRYQYRYESGHSGEAPLAGFAIRGREIVIYISCDQEHQLELRSKLGPHRMGKSCLYFKRLDDLDKSVLESLISRSVDEVRET